MFAKLFNRVTSQANNDLTMTGLRLTLTAWALLVIFLAWYLDNKWALATLLAYEILP
jgi:hypothetical protein